MRVTKNELDKIVDEYCEKNQGTCHIYVVMKWGYTEKEMLNSSYNIELLMPDYEYGYRIVWEIDWWEGEEFIDFYGIYTDEDVIRYLTNGQTV